MRIIGLSCRRGTSTALGTLIFIGIMFTAVIPMLIVMRQADTLHEMRKFELERFDEERERAEIHVYVYNKTTSSESLTLRVENWGDFSVNIMRIWINDTYHILENFNVQPTNSLERDLTDFTAFPDTRYFIKVTNDRGNIFFTESGSLYCDKNGNWETGFFTISFTISKNQPAGWYDVEVRRGNETGPLECLPFQIHKTRHASADYFCDVSTAGTYHVKITKGSEVIYNDDVTIHWPNGPRSVPVRV